MATMQSLIFLAGLAIASGTLKPRTNLDELRQEKHEELMEDGRPVAKGIQKGEKTEAELVDPNIKLTALHAEDGKPVVQRLWSDEGMAYYGQMSVGGQMQNAIYDTGSFDLVVLSTCMNKAELKKKNTILKVLSNSSSPVLKSHGAHDKIVGEGSGRHGDPSKLECCPNSKCPKAAYNSFDSANFVKGNQDNEEIVYGSGPVTVKPGFEHISVKTDTNTFGHQSQEIADDDVPIKVIVDHELDLFQETALQAIVGLGPGEFDERDDRLVHHLAVKRFMICFSEDQSKEGYITWNDKDRSKEVGWTPVPVKGKLFWATPTTNFRLEGGHLSSGLLGMFPKKASDVGGCWPSCGAIVDTGTSLLTPPQEVIDEMSKAIDAGSLQHCEDLDKFPTFKFKLGDEEFSLPPAAYIGDAGETEAGFKHKNLALPVLPMTKQGLRLMNEAKAKGLKAPTVRSCALLLSAGDESDQTPWGPMVIFGMSLFRKYAVQFDLAGDLSGDRPTLSNPTRMMRFAEASPDCSGMQVDGKRKPLFEFKRRSLAKLPKVNLNKMRISPLQHQLNLLRQRKGTELLHKKSNLKVKI